MAKISKKPITSYKENWKDDGTGAGVPVPHDGDQVMEYLQQAVRNISFFDNGALYFFESFDKRQRWLELSDIERQIDHEALQDGQENLYCSMTPLSFSGFIYDVKFASDVIVASSTSTSYTSSVTITIPKVSTTRRGVLQSANEAETFPEEYELEVQMSINDGEYERYEPFCKDNLSANVETKFTLPKTSGTYKFRAKVKGKESKTSSTKFTESPVITKYYTTWSSSVNNWYLPYIQGGSYNARIFSVTTSTTAVVTYAWTKIRDKNGKTVSVSAGSGTAGTASGGSNGSTRTTSISVNPNAPTQGTGVYELKCYLRIGTSSGTSVSNSSTYHMYVATADVNTANLITWSGATSDTIVNGSTINPIVSISVYNKGITTDNVNVTLKMLHKAISEDGADNEIEEKGYPVVPHTSTKLSYTPEIESVKGDWTADVSLAIGTGDTKFESVIISGRKVTNDNPYAPTSGTVFYLNPKRRGNYDTYGNDRVVNGMNKNVTYPVNIKNFNFIDDYYYEDSEGRPCLLVPARCRFEIPESSYKPMFTTTNGLSFDFTLKIANVSNDNEPVVTMSDEWTDRADESWKGIRICGSSVKVHPESATGSNDALQEYVFKPDEIMHVAIVYHKVHPVAKCAMMIIYFNGAKVREYVINNYSSVSNSFPLVLGSNSCDLYLYGLRVYNKSLDDFDVQNNYVASLDSNKQKRASELINSIYSEKTVDYNKCKTIGNVFVIELDSQYTFGIPNKLHPDGKNYKPTGKLSMYYQGYSTPYVWESVKYSGQGSSSRNYLRWNLDAENKSNTADALPWSPYDSINIHKLCFKKNFASGTHGHKMGMTRVYDALHKELFGNTNNVAVKQYLFYGFLKKGSSYEFIGLYTGGPSKDDQYWFGYNGKTYISLEGENHNLEGALFSYPFSGFVKNEESFDIVKTNGTPDAQWSYSQDSDTLDTLWRNAYNHVYKNGLNIMMAGNVPSSYNDTRHGYNNIILSNGDSYFFNRTTGKWTKDDFNALDQVNTAGLTSEYNSASSDANRIRVIKKARRILFKKDIGKYWNADVMMFEYMYKIINSISDNFAKNFYPQSIAPSNIANARVGARQDDLDTFGPINNSGINGKPYWGDFGDTYVASGTTYNIFNGEASNFAQMLASIGENQGDPLNNNDKTDGFDSQRTLMARRILDAMESLGTDPDPSALQSQFDKWMNFYENYIWIPQRTLPASAYNEDIKWTYEYARSLFGTSYKDAPNPMDQVTGPAYETEYDWFVKRLIFISSKYEYGDFATKISTRHFGTLFMYTSQQSEIELTYSISHYPIMVTGEQSNETPHYITKSSRDLTRVVVEAGEPCVFTTAAESVRTRFLLGDYITSVSSDNVSFYDDVNISLKRLETFSISSVDASKKLEFSNCPSLYKVDLSGSSITGLSFVNCPRLAELNAIGNSMSTITISDNTRIETIKFPDTITGLDYKGFKNVKTVTFGYNNNATSYKKIDTIKLQNCIGFPAFTILKNAVSQNPTRTFTVAIVNNTETIDNATDANAMIDFLKDTTIKMSVPEGFSKSIVNSIIKVPASVATSRASDIASIKTKYNNELIISA